MGGVAIAGGLVAAGGAYAASKQASKAAKPTKGQQQLEALALDNAKKAQPYGMDFLGRGGTNMQMFDDFYRKLATGDRNEALKLLAPQFRQLDQQSAAALGSQMSLGGRGGGSAERRIQSMDDLNAARQDAVLGLRTGAVDQLGQMGLQQAQAGSALLGQSSSGSLGLLGSIQGRRDSAFEQSRAVGQGMYDMMKQLGGAGISGYQTWRDNRQPQPLTPSRTISQFQGQTHGVRR
jgi:hypothetical protein